VTSQTAPWGRFGTSALAPAATVTLETAITTGSPLKVHTASIV
jgi:hypothetical protein